MSQGFTNALTLPLPVASGGTGVGNSNWTAGSLTFNPTTQGIVGTTTNDSASAGYVGEFISSYSSSGVSLTTNVVANGTSISLTAGDWDVYANAYFQPSGSASEYQVAITATSATMTDASYYTRLQVTGMTGTGIPAPPIRVSISGTTTYYLVVKAVFASGTVDCQRASLYARRRR